jgi:hypothetical protein
MNQFSALVKSLLASTGIYSDAAVARIEKALAANPGMPLLEGILKFGGEKEALFLEKIGGVLNLMLKMKMKKGTADLNFLFVHNMPLRAIAKMTNGMVSMGMIDGLVMELKGFWIIGLCRMGYEFVRNLILNGRQKKRLDAADR